MADGILTFDYKPVGTNGRATLTARLGEEILALDKLDMQSASARDQFAERLCVDRPGIDRAAVDEQLLGIATEVQARRETTPDPADASDELDVSKIVRAELFHTREVSGLTVAVPVLFGNEPAGQWRLYLRWADGRREATPLPDSLTLPDKSVLWVRPALVEAPSISTTPAWAETNRKAWVAGADPPDPAEVFRRLCECVAYFLELPDENAPGAGATLALWVMLSYAYPAWGAIPYLYLGGPLGSGKTRVFEVLSRLVFRPLQSSSITGPALFRTLNSRGGTLLFDEAERLRQPTPDVGEVNSMLLAGYKRGGRAMRLEPFGDTFRTVDYDVYGPKALACIAGLPAALGSRCITLTMFRAGSDSPKPRRRIDAHGGRLRSLRGDLHALALDYGRDFLDLAGRDDVCPAMSGRQFELWQPLLALAAWTEDHGAKGLLALMQRYAAESNESATDDQIPDADEMLLHILADHVKSAMQDELTPGGLLAKAKDVELSLFRKWSPQGVGRALGRYGVRSGHSGPRTYRKVTRRQLRRIEERYGMDLGIRAKDMSDMSETSTADNSAKACPLITS